MHFVWLIVHRSTLYFILGNAFASGQRDLLIEVIARHGPQLLFRGLTEVLSSIRQISRQIRNAEVDGEDLDIGKHHLSRAGSVIEVQD